MVTLGLGVVEVVLAALEGSTEVEGVLGEGIDIIWVVELFKKEIVNIKTKTGKRANSTYECFIKILCLEKRKFQVPYR